MNPELDYFLVNRKLLQSKRWLSEPFTRAQAWVDLIGLAQYHDSSFYIRGNRVDVQRGQLAWSSEALARRWKWSRGKIIRFLEELEKDANIIQQKSPIITIITILDYNRWQGNRTTDGQQKDNRRTHTKKYIRNIYKEKEEYIPEFERFWQAYPRKKGRKEALKAWQALKPSPELVETILTAIERQKNGAEWKKDGGRFIKYPQGWLNGRRWEDEVEQLEGILKL